MTSLLPALVILTGLQASPATAPGSDATAVISLFNPTAWKGALVVEVPTGSVAAPGVLDWRRVHLEVENKSVPFAIRAGQAGGRVRSKAADSVPRAEDLLVFTCALPRGEWTRVRVVQGASANEGRGEHLVRAGGQCTIAYDNVKVAVEEPSGLLREFSYLGEPLLAGPLGVEVARLSATAAYELVGSFGPGPADPADRDRPRVVVNRGEAIPWTGRLISAASSGAMTQLNFLIEASSGPAIALSYRVHANGVVDIVGEGQAWTGETPWLSHAVAYALPLIGKQVTVPLLVPLLEERFPFYGFKGYTASVRQTACVHRGTQVGLVELGEETVNGRRWTRKLVPYALSDEADAKSLVEAVDEGPIVEVLPVRSEMVSGGLKVEFPSAAHAAGEKLIKGLKAAGVKVDTSATDDGGPRLRLEMVTGDEAAGIEGDGFQIRKVEDDPQHGQKYSVRAISLNGLYQASTAIAEHVARYGASLPLVARNPVVALRAGGFGGGPTEVDFPYGSDEEWKQTLENLVVSGMNHFACLGMWGNWKMPVTYRYMPELRSTEPEAYDESSGARFAEIEQHRARGLELTRFLHERGAAVWLWMPIGCVPTTFEQKFPEAMAPRDGGGRSAKTPCFTHPEYRRYLEAFFRELLETYPIQGMVLIRDDNGELCNCERCKAYMAGSRTKQAAWEQYLVIYDMLRSQGFRGDVAVYAYYDQYAPRLDPLLPKELYVVGHGGEPAILTRDFARVGLMGDTWLDNLYSDFRLPPSPRMRRLLGDRGSFWIGGAYCGTELPWESIGRFGWEPTATPNTLRYEWGARTFGREHALAFVRLNAVYEHLWEINARYLLPEAWMRLGADERQKVLEEGLACVGLLRQRLAQLRAESDAAAHARWFGHMELFVPFIEYHLHRLDLFARTYDLVLAHQEAIKRGEPLADDLRRSVLAWYREMYDWAGKYDAAMKRAPEGMLTHCRWMTQPYKEFVAGYDLWLDSKLGVKQFAGDMRMTVDGLKAGEPFAVRMELHNAGACPWVPEMGQVLELSGVAQKLGLPETWSYEGEWMAPGDRRTITLRGTAPKEPGAGLLKAVLRAPIGPAEGFMSCEANLTWK